MNSKHDASLHRLFSLCRASSSGKVPPAAWDNMKLASRPSLHYQNSTEQLQEDWHLVLQQKLTLRSIEATVQARNSACSRVPARELMKGLIKKQRKQVSCGYRVKFGRTKLRQCQQSSYICNNTMGFPGWLSSRTSWNCQFTKAHRERSCSKSRAESHELLPEGLV